VAIENGQPDIAEKAMRTIIAESLDMIDKFHGE